MTRSLFFFYIIIITIREILEVVIVVVVLNERYFKKYLSRGSGTIPTIRTIRGIWLAKGRMKMGAIVEGQVMT